MKDYCAACWAEGLKIRRSTILWVTMLAFWFIPTMTGIMMYVIKNPDVAYKFGMIGSKAAMIRFGEANWATYMGLLTQIIAGVGLLGFGFIASWVFGREYSDRTAKDWLALPASRSMIVMSKFTAVLVWSILLGLVLLAFGLLTGAMLKLDGWSTQLAREYAYPYAVTLLLTILLCTPVAFFASCGRGYLMPLGFVILTLVLAQFVGVVGLGPYFPWAIPLLVSVAGTADGTQLQSISFIILGLTSLLGLMATLAWWRYADQY